MGQIRKGILGGFTGKVGIAMGDSWSGIDYLTLCPISDNLELKESSGKTIGEFMGYVATGPELESLREVLGTEKVWMVKAS